MAMIIMLIRLLIAFFLYNDAKKRGRGAITAILWSVGSVVVPYVILPIYLPAYFLLGRKTKAQNQYDNDIIDIEATVVEETLNCTRCGNQLKEDFLVCPYCQEPIGTSKKDN